MFGAHLPDVLYVMGIAALLAAIFWRPVIGIYYLVPLIPLQTVRYRLLDYPLGPSVVGIILAGVMIGLLVRGRSILPRTPWTLLLCVYVLFTLVSLCLGSLYVGDNLLDASGGSRLASWKDYIQLPVLLLLVAAAVRERREIFIIIVLMCVTTLLMNRSLWNTFSGRDYSTYSHDLREEGSMGYAGANGLAAFEAQSACFLLAMAACEKKRLRSAAYWGLAGLSAVCLMYSLSRGAYAAMAAGWLFLGLVKQRKLLILMVVFAVTWTLLVPTAVRMRVDSTYDAGDGELDHSSELRIQLWEEALPLFLSNPVLGTGFYTYQSFHNMNGYGDTHNLYLKALVETGVVGLILLLAILVVSFRAGYRLFRRAGDPMYAGLGLGLAAWIVCAGVANLFGDRWMYLQVQGYLWVIGGLVARATQLETVAKGDTGTALAELTPVEEPAPAV